MAVYCFELTPKTSAPGMQRVSWFLMQANQLLKSDAFLSHIHVSLRTKDGKNVFALPDADVKKGRAGAEYDDTRFMSQEGEWFLAGILDGLTDSKGVTSTSIAGC